MQNSNSATWPTAPAGARAWVEGFVPVVGAEIIADTPRSMVVRLTTPEGRLYFKADRILPPPEGVVVSHLAQIWPDRVPRVVAIDAMRGWSLTRDAGPMGLMAAPTATWCRVATAFGEIQRATGRSADEWVALGCRDLRGDRLAVAIERMIDWARPGLSDAERARLDARRSRFADTCAALTEGRVPATLVHQDLVPVNIVLRAAGPVFIDWSDTVVGHPFFGFDRLLDSCWRDAPRKAAVIEAYLAAFEGVDTAERLRASFGHVLSLRVLYECVRWHHELQAIDHDSPHARSLAADVQVGLRAMAQ